MFALEPIIAALAELAASVAEALGFLVTINSGINLIKQVLGLNGPNPPSLLVMDANILFISDQGTISLLDIKNQLTAIATAVGAPQQTGSPVTLPTTPPAGYGGPSSSTIASDVWAYKRLAGVQDTYSFVTAAGGLPTFMNEAGLYMPSADAQYWGWFGPWDEPFGNQPRAATVHTINASTILPTDSTMLSWLQRVYPSDGWFDAGGGLPAMNDTGGSGEWVCTMSPLEFIYHKSGFGGGSSVVVPPVWPGLANVTLGTSQPLADGLVIVGPLSGVILTITGVPPATPFYGFGTRLSYKWLGGITFVDDNGQAEEAQPLGFDNLIITPRKMAQAASAVLRLKSGTTGTIQPFLNH